MTATSSRFSLPPVVATHDALREAVATARRDGRTIGFVPTMGALHAGHISLVEQCRRECGFTVVSIFVNPTQFGPREDYDRYPRDVEGDLAILAPQQIDLVFAPPREEIYRDGHATMVDVGGLADKLEGASRPGHFRGVATVVLKLFQLVLPDVAYFGQKDYQQTLVVRRMVDDLDVPVKVRVCPTVREADGLALSSRNAYLSADDRQRALVLSRSLALAAGRFASGERDAIAIKAAMRGLFQQAEHVTLDYAVVLDGETLAEADQASARSVALVAARVGGVRLIDNCYLDQRPTWQSS